MDLVEDCYGYACKGPVAAAIILCLVAAPIGQGKSLVKAWWNECYGAAIMIAATFSPGKWWGCLLYTSPSPRDGLLSRMPSSA